MAVEIQTERDCNGRWILPLTHLQQPERNQLIDFVFMQLHWDGSQAGLPQVAVPSHALSAEQGSGDAINHSSC
jgi:hypothetical protein